MAGQGLESMACMSLIDRRATLLPERSNLSYGDKSVVCSTVPLGTIGDLRMHACPIPLTPPYLTVSMSYGEHGGERPFRTDCIYGMNYTQQPHHVYIDSTGNTPS